MIDSKLTVTRDTSALSPQSKIAWEALTENGRVRTTTNLERLAMIELKAMGLAVDPVDDVWEVAK